MCASCGHKTGLSFAKSLAVAIPVPLALALGFLVPGGEDRLLLWTAGTIATFTLYFRWISLPRQNLVAVAFRPLRQPHSR